MNPFDVLLVNPLINILVAIYQLLLLVHVPFALGFAIIVLTIVIRGILYPLTSAQLNAAKKMQGVSKHIANLKTKHKGDAKKLQAETMKLYKEHGINPAAGCLPVLIQLPIIWALYTVLQKVVGISSSEVVSQINNIVYSPVLHLAKPWDPTFFGASLGQGPSSLMSSIGSVVLLVPIITGAFQFIQSKMMLPEPVKGEKKSDKKSEDFATAFQTQSVYIFPVMIAFFSYTLPLGLSLYWNTFSVFGIIQQYKVAGWGGMTAWIKKI